MQELPVEKGVVTELFKILTCYIWMVIETSNKFCCVAVIEEHILVNNLLIVTFRNLAKDFIRCILFPIFLFACYFGKSHVLAHVLVLNYFHATDLILYPLKTLGNFCFSDIFRGCKRKPVA